MMTGILKLLPGLAAFVCGMQGHAGPVTRSAANSGFKRAAHHVLPRGCVMTMIMRWGRMKPSKPAQ